MTDEQLKPDARAQQSENQRTLLERIEALALLYTPSAREIPEAAWKFWFDAVKGSTLAEISQAIADWSKTSSRMMMPADLYKLLQNKRSLKREQAAAEEVEKEHQPLPKNVADVYIQSMQQSIKKNIPADAGARRNRIKEAYGFAMSEFVRKSWRSMLGLSEGYRFGDTNGVFPLEEFPDERRSLYHDCHIHFIKDYEEKHGLELVYDKELATKRYPTRALRYTGAGEPVKESATW